MKPRKVYKPEGYYVYIHKTADTGRPFYVGKGKGYRAYNAKKRNKWWHGIAHKHGFTVEIMAEGLTEELAFEFEIMAISVIPGLCNLSEGGEGVSGFRHSEESKDKMRKPKSEETKERMKAAQRNKPPCSPETIAKMSAAKIGKVYSDETKARVSAAGRRRYQRASERVAQSERLIAHKGRAVRCVETGVEFRSLSLAAEWLRSIGNTLADGSSIRYVTTGKYRHCYGYTWELIQ